MRIGTAEKKTERRQTCTDGFSQWWCCRRFWETSLTVYQTVFAMQQADAYVIMAVTVMAIASLSTAIGVYDQLSRKCGAGMFVPISGFANSLTSSALEGKSEGWVMGIGCNMFKLAGTVITYGVVGACDFWLFTLSMDGRYMMNTIRFDHVFYTVECCLCGPDGKERDRAALLLSSYQQGISMMDRIPLRKAKFHAVNNSSCDLTMRKQTCIWKT